MFYLMKSKAAIFSNIEVTKIERSPFFGTPGIYKDNLLGLNKWVDDTLLTCFNHKAEFPIKNSVIFSHFYVEH